MKRFFQRAQCGKPQTTKNEAPKNNEVDNLQFKGERFSFSAVLLITDTQAV